MTNTTDYTPRYLGRQVRIHASGNPNNGRVGKVDQARHHTSPGEVSWLTFRVSFGPADFDWFGGHEVSFDLIPGVLPEAVQ